MTQQTSPTSDSWSFGLSDGLAELLGSNQIDRKLWLYAEAVDTVADWYDADRTDCRLELDEGDGPFRSDSLEELRDVVQDGGRVTEMELRYDDGGETFGLSYDDGAVEYEADPGLEYRDRLWQDLDTL